MIFVGDNDEILDYGQAAANFNNTPHNRTQYLETCDWTALLASNPVFDLESVLNCLSSNLQMAIEELAPLKTVTPRKGNRPWVRPNL